VSLGGKVKAVLNWRKDIGTGDVQVETQDSTVTLKGKIGTEREHKIILDLVNGITGVDKVVDQLQVG